ERNVEQELPVVVRVWTAVGEIDLLGKVRNAHHLARSSFGVGSRKEDLGETLLVVGVEQTLERFLVELGDELTQVRVKEVFESVAESDVVLPRHDPAELHRGLLVVVVVRGGVIHSGSPTYLWRPLPEAMAPAGPTVV